MKSKNSLEKSLITQFNHHSIETELGIFEFDQTQLIDGIDVVEKNKVFLDNEAIYKGSLTKENNLRLGETNKCGCTGCSMKSGEHLIKRMGWNEDPS